MDPSGIVSGLPDNRHTDRPDPPPQAWGAETARGPLAAALWKALRMTDPAKSVFRRFRPGKQLPYDGDAVGVGVTVTLT